MFASFWWLFQVLEAFDLSYKCFSCNFLDMTEEGYLEAGFFEDLLNQVDSHPDWEYSGSNSHSMAGLAENFEEYGGPAAVYEPVEGDGVLKVRRVYSNDNALTGSLQNPIGPSMPGEPEEGSFADKLGKASSAITSQESRTDYVRESSPENDPVVAATVAVPAEYDAGELDKALTDAHAINEEVSQLHTDLVNLVEASLDR